MITIDKIREQNLRIENLTYYDADKGSAVVNGVCLSNGVGDGRFQVYVCDKKPKDMKEIVWIDLRATPRIDLWLNDCDRTSRQDYYPANFYDADAIGLGFDADGNLYIWKMF